MRDLPHLTYLQAFEAAARHLSFTRAAEELNCTQAAISQRVRGLEQYFGRPLFQRRANGLELSQAGQAYLPGATQALDMIEAATRGLTGHGPRQSVTVSAPLSLVNLWLAPRIDGFLADHPGTALRMNAAIWTDPNLDLADVSLSIVERALTPPDAHPLASLPLTRVVPTGPGAAAGGDFRRIAVQGKYSLWDLWSAAAGESRSTGAPLLLVDTAATALELVAAGAGQAVVHSLYVDEATAAGRPVIAEGVRVDVGHRLVLRSHPDRRLGPGARAFIDWLSGGFPAAQRQV